MSENHKAKQGINAITVSTMFRVHNCNTCMVFHSASLFATGIIQITVLSAKIEYLDCLNNGSILPTCQPLPTLPPVLNLSILQICSISLNCRPYRPRLTVAPASCQVCLFFLPSVCLPSLCLPAYIVCLPTFCQYTVSASCRSAFLLPFLPASCLSACSCLPACLQDVCLNLA
jgi:hypothetical protein